MQREVEPNWSRIEAYAAKDRVALLELLEGLESDLAKHWATVNASLENRDHRALGTVAHSCKSVFGLVGWAESSTMSAQLESELVGGLVDISCLQVQLGKLRSAVAERLKKEQAAL